MEEFNHLEYYLDTGTVAQTSCHSSLVATLLIVTSFGVEVARERGWVDSNSGREEEEGWWIDDTFSSWWRLSDDVGGWVCDVALVCVCVNSRVGGVEMRVMVVFWEFVMGCRDGDFLGS